MTTRIQDVSLAKLVPSKANVRRSGRRENIGELAASIATAFYEIARAFALTVARATARPPAPTAPAGAPMPRRPPTAASGHGKPAGATIGTTRRRHPRRRASEGASRPWRRRKPSTASGARVRR